MGSLTAAPAVPGLWITGIGAQYPPYFQEPQKLDAFAKRFADVTKPGCVFGLQVPSHNFLMTDSSSLQKLLAVNKGTGIDTRATIRTYESGFACQTEPPSIRDIDEFFRDKGVGLTVQACRKALREWGGSSDTITQ